MRMQKFEDVKSWRLDKQLYVELLLEFKNSKNYLYKCQLLRSTLLITNNIAVRFDWGSNKELRQSLLISRRSCAEVRSMLHITTNTGLINEVRYNELVILTNNIWRLLSGFIKKLETADRRMETNK